MESIDLLSLVPNFSELFTYLGMLLTGDQDRVFSPNELSALFVLILLSLLLIFGVIALYAFYSAGRNTSKIRSVLEGLTKENLNAKREEAKHRAQQLGEIGNIWLEFDESLVLVSRDSGDRLHNTIDSDHFFNFHTLAPALTENRLLAAVPGILTAIGVIGTFMGLQIGLQNVDFSGDTDDLRQGIEAVVSAAAVAFLTSVWGVFTSVVFNLFEKILEQSNKQRITDLQNKIDFLFPRLGPEQSLVSIADSARSTEDSLNGLAERIGEKLTSAVSDMSAEVTKGIQDAITPAAELIVEAASSLADKQADGASEALGKIVESFTGRVQEAGERQRDLMNKATSELQETVSKLGARMDGFLDKLNDAAESTSRLNEEKQQRLFDELSAFSENMRGDIERQTQESKHTMERTQAVGETLEALTENLKQVIIDLDTYSNKLETASSGISEAGSRISDAATTLESEIKSAARSVTELSQGNNQVVENMNSLMAELSQLQSNLFEASETIEKSNESAAASFAELSEKQRGYLTELDSLLQKNSSTIKSSIGELEEKASEFLNEYSTIVRDNTTERLNAWNQQTEEFTQQMIAAVEAMNSVISELEDQAERN